MSFPNANLLSKKNATTEKLRRFLSYMRQNYLLYLFLVLPVTYFIIFKYVPMYGVTIAFKDYNMFLGIWKSPWNNFRHLKRYSR